MLFGATTPAAGACGAIGRGAALGATGARFWGAAGTGFLGATAALFGGVTGTDFLAAAAFFCGSALAGCAATSVSSKAAFRHFDLFEAPSPRPRRSGKLADSLGIRDIVRP